MGDQRSAEVAGIDRRDFGGSRGRGSGSIGGGRIDDRRSDGTHATLPCVVSLLHYFYLFGMNAVTYLVFYTALLSNCKVGCF